MQGNLYVVAAPSGAGKTSLVDGLIKKNPQLILSISYTTRQPRPGEKSGEHYHFVSTEEFKKLIEQHAFLEYACVFDNYYGTSKSWVMQQLEQGKDVILEIDWQGAEQIKRIYPQAITIFILPPSLSALEDRLKKRAQDPPEVIAKRLHTAEEDLQHARHFDYQVVNDDFATALAELQTIIKDHKSIQ